MLEWVNRSDERAQTIQAMLDRSDEPVAIVDNGEDLSGAVAAGKLLLDSDARDVALTSLRRVVEFDSPAGKAFAVAIEAIRNWRPQTRDLCRVIRELLQTAVMRDDSHWTHISDALETFGFRGADEDRGAFPGTDRKTAPTVFRAPITTP